MKITIQEKWIWTTKDLVRRNLCLLSLRPLNSQAQSSFKCTYSVHLERNLQFDIQEDPGRRIKILRKEGTSPSLYSGHIGSSKYLPFRSISAWYGFIFSLPLAFAPPFNHLPTLLNWPSNFNVCCFSFTFSFFSRPFWIL